MTGRGARFDATVPSYGHRFPCQPFSAGAGRGPAGSRNAAVLIAGKVLQAAALAFLGVSYVLKLPATPRGRDLAIAAGVFLVGWLLIRNGGAGKA